MVTHFISNEYSFDLAIETLQKRYGDPQKIHEQLRVKLNKMPKSSMRITDLQKTWDKITNIHHQFLSLGKDLSMNTFFLDMIQEKFPQDKK